MAKTREELLALADECIKHADAAVDAVLPQSAIALAQLAQACIMLAKELPSAKGEEIVLHFELTGEVRPPRKGEWFLSKISDTPAQSECDFEFSAFPILRIVYEDE